MLVFHAAVEVLLCRLVARGVEVHRAQMLVRLVPLVFLVLCESHRRWGAKQEGDRQRETRDEPAKRIPHGALPCFCGHCSLSRRSWLEVHRDGASLSGEFPRPLSKTAESPDDHDRPMLVCCRGGPDYGQRGVAVPLSLRRLPGRTWQGVFVQLVSGTGRFSCPRRDRDFHSENDSSYQVQTVRNVSVRRGTRVRRARRERRSVARGNVQSRVSYSMSVCRGSHPR